MGYCVLCGRWDKKQGGFGHSKSCAFPTASTIGHDKGTREEAEAALKRSKSLMFIADSYAMSTPQYTMPISKIRSPKLRIPRHHAPPRSTGIGPPTAPPTGWPRPVTTRVGNPPTVTLLAVDYGLYNGNILPIMPLKLPPFDQLKVGDIFGVGNNAEWECMYKNAPKNNRVGWQCKPPGPVPMTIKLEVENNAGYLVPMWQYTWHRITY